MARTLAHQASGAQGWQVVVSTGDKDMAQLVNAQVTLVNTMTSETLTARGAQVRRAARAHHRFSDADRRQSRQRARRAGVRPETAAKWLAEHGSLDAIIAAADSVKGKAGEKLRAALPHLPLSRQLVTIKPGLATCQPTWPTAWPACATANRAATAAGAVPPVRVSQLAARAGRRRQRAGPAR